ncbi:hypothetical protein COOONC_08973 [Cooperia oncophora]
MSEAQKELTSKLAIHLGLSGLRSQDEVKEAAESLVLFRGQYAKAAGLTMERALPVTPLIAMGFQAVPHRFFGESVLGLRTCYATLDQAKHCALASTIHSTVTSYQTLKITRPSGDTGEHIPAPWISAMRVMITQTSRTHQPVATTQISGAMLNLVTAAGRVDNAAIYNIIKMRSAVTGVSFEEAAPARLCLMRKSWPGGLICSQIRESAIPRYEDIEMDSICSAHEADEIQETEDRDGSDHFRRVRSHQNPGSSDHWVVRRFECDVQCPCECHTDRCKRIDDSAFWLYVMSFLDTRVWQGLSKYITIGRLNMGLIDQSKAKELKYTDESQFDVVLAPYSDTVLIPGPRKILIVIIDASSKSDAQSPAISTQSSFMFDTPSVTTNCIAVCPGGTVNFTIKGSLAFVNERAISSDVSITNVQREVESDLSFANDIFVTFKDTIVTAAKGVASFFSFDVVLAPYSDTVLIPGPRKILIVIIDASSKSDAQSPAISTQSSFMFDTPSVTTNCIAVCPGGTVNFTIKGSLAFVNERAISSDVSITNVQREVESDLSFANDIFVTFKDTIVTAAKDHC